MNAEFEALIARMQAWPQAEQEKAAYIILSLERRYAIQDGRSEEDIAEIDALIAKCDLDAVADLDR
jgi:hypothetical protein